MAPYCSVPASVKRVLALRAYLTVWRLPSAPVLLLAGFAGRLPSAMVPLALLLMVQQQTGSYAVAGLASATHGIAMAVMAPLLGRLADRGSEFSTLTQRAMCHVRVGDLHAADAVAGQARAIIGNGPVLIYLALYRSIVRFKTPTWL